MAACKEMEVDLRGAKGERCGVLRIRLLPGARTDAQPPPLVDLRGSGELDLLEPVQLLEGQEYLYEVEAGASPLQVEPRELFLPDTERGDRGRLRTGLRPGRLRVQVFAEQGELGQVALEIRSRKLDAARDHRAMLRDLASAAAELLMERHAPTSLTFAPEPDQPARLLYARFELIRSLLEGAPLAAALEEILRRPHQDWEPRTELQPTAHGLPPSAVLGRQLSRPAPRPGAAFGPARVALPAELELPQSSPTFDTAPNRFARFALEHWRDEVELLQRALHAQRLTPARERGLHASAHVHQRLRELLSAPALRAAGRMEQLEEGFTVIARRPGYRELLQAHLASRLASQLSQADGELLFEAGIRDVAALYEAWCGLQLARATASVCNVPLDLRSLIEPRADGLAIVLARGERRVLSGSVERLGRRLRVELWFNRTFPRGEGDGSSWSRPMRPDMSLRIEVEQSDPALPPVWLHFDAKYRAEVLEELMGADDSSPVASAKGDDLAKMHAYRDAIRRSAGAFVLYPGSESEAYQSFRELLPGLGAFALRPSEHDDARGASALADFLEEVLQHLASQGTAHERARFWEATIHAEPPVSPALRASPLLRKPPADTRVLVGFVKSAAHLAWIHELHLYNLRADGRTGSLGVDAPELAADFVLLYGPPLERPELWSLAGGPELQSADSLARSGYPEARGALYLCLPLGDELTGLAQLPATNASLERYRLERARRAFGAPFMASWLDLSR